MRPFGFCWKAVTRPTGQSLGLGVEGLYLLLLSPPDRLVMVGRSLPSFRDALSRELSEHPRPAHSSPAMMGKRRAAAVAPVQLTFLPRTVH